MVARPLDETDRALSRIKALLFFIAAGGILVAGGLGLAVSRTALAPVRRLTQATETVTETRDLSERIEAGSKDELGRLAMSFNAMLAALEESDRARSQLVADASHELRTPLTSLRPNIEVLARDRHRPQTDDGVLPARPPAAAGRARASALRRGRAAGRDDDADRRADRARTRRAA